MFRELKLLRKNNTHTIIIGHTRKDIPKDILRQMFIINKLSEKEAELGYGIIVMNGQDRMEVSNIQMTISSIPETDIEYEPIEDHGYEIYFDDDDAKAGKGSPDSTANPTPDSSEIKFPDDVEGKTEEIKYLSEILGMKNKEIADYLDESEEVVSYHINK